MVRRRHRGLTPRDVFLASYPKSGNTWLRFVLADIAVGRDIGYAETDRAIPSVGEHADAPATLPGGGRMIKTHEPFQRRYRRAVLVLRDPRDVVLSYRRFLTGYGIHYDGIDRFVELFMEGRIGSYGSWVDHTRGWLAARAGGVPVLVLTYEGIKADPVGRLGEAARFVGLEAGPERVALAVERNSAARMRDKERADREYFDRLGWRREANVSFVGKATSGEWRDRLDEGQLRRLEPATELYRRATGG